MNGKILHNLLEDAQKSGARIAREQLGGIAVNTSAPTKYCETCQAHRPYQNDGDFDICVTCANPILNEDEVEALNQSESEVRLDASEGRVF